MTRLDAYQILTKYISDKNLLHHSLATEAAMRALYIKITPTEVYNKDEEEKWRITGLLHDADYALAIGKPEQHGMLLFTKEPNKIPPDIEYAIKAHNFAYTKIQPKKIMDFALIACDQLTAIIIVIALAQPDKRLYLVTPQIILDKLKDKSFAKGADKKNIMICESHFQIPLYEFVTLVLKSMQEIGKELGL